MRRSLTVGTSRLRIGCGAGFQGDRIDAAVVLAERGELDWMVLECLAERTIAAAQLRRRADPGGGFDPLLRARMRALLPLCASRHFRIVTNMGAADPLGAGHAVRTVAHELGLDIRVAVVCGDDVLDRIDPAAPALETGRPLSDHGPLVSANAYLGAEALLPAIDGGAQVIVTGRVADPSLFVAPLAHAFGWPPDDPSPAAVDRLAAGTLVGHLLECAGQVSGGYFADPGLKDVPDLAHLGFPYCDVDADGAGVLGKAAGTGGAITLQTVREQLLYEVADPGAYLTPDVIADFRSVCLSEVGRDRVAVRGARGTPRTGTLKVSVGYEAGFLGEGEISYAGPGARARAMLAGHVVRERLAPSFDGLRVELIGVDAVLGRDYVCAGDPSEVRLRVAGAAASRERAESVGREVEALYTNGPAGGGGARSRVTERIGVASTLLPREAVQPTVTWLQAVPGCGRSEGGSDPAHTPRGPAR